MTSDKILAEVLDLLQPEGGGLSGA
jgi:hypothetical protein